jgi:hypothetical protein
VIRRVTYSIVNNQLVRRQIEDVTVDVDQILDNVNQFFLTYFVDSGGDRRYHSGAERTAANVPAGANIVAVRVQLSARPASNNPDVTTQVSPRGLDTVVTMRNELNEKK